MSGAPGDPPDRPAVAMPVPATPPAARRGRGDGPRTPLRVAVMTFGAVVLLGTLAALVVFQLRGRTGATPFAQGEAMGRGIGILGAIAAAIAFVIQKRRTGR